MRVLPAFSTQHLNCLHHPTVQDQDASNKRAAALRSLRSKRHSAGYGVLLFEGTPSALLDRFGLTAPNLRTQLRWVEHYIYWINKFSFRRFDLRCQKGSGSFPMVGSCHLEGAPSGSPWGADVLCVGTRYGGIHLPTFVILFRRYIVRDIISPKHVAIV